MSELKKRSKKSKLRNKEPLTTKASSNFFSINGDSAVRSLFDSNFPGANSQSSTPCNGNNDNRSFLTPLHGKPQLHTATDNFRVNSRTTLNFDSVQSPTEQFSKTFFGGGHNPSGKNHSR